MRSRANSVSGCGLTPWPFITCIHYLHSSFIFKIYFYFSFSSCRQQQNVNSTLLQRNCLNPFKQHKNVSKSILLINQTILLVLSNNRSIFWCKMMKWSLLKRRPLDVLIIFKGRYTHSFKPNPMEIHHLKFSYV